MRVACGRAKNGVNKTKQNNQNSIGAEQQQHYPRIDASRGEGGVVTSEVKAWSDGTGVLWLFLAPLQLSLKAIHAQHLKKTKKKKEKAKRKKKTLVTLVKQHLHTV